MTGLLISSVLATLVVVWWTWRAFWRRCEAASEVDWGGVWINRVDGLLRVFNRRYHRLEGPELALPETGPAIVVANHISGLDPFIVLVSCRRPIRFLMAREEYERFGLKWLFRSAGCIPVDRSTQPERAMREAVKVLEAGEVVGLFPQGEIITDPANRKLKGGAVRLAQLTGTAIYPLVIRGVKGRGWTALALVFRSRVRIEQRAIIDCSNLSYADAMVQMAEAIREQE